MILALRLSNSGFRGAMVPSSVVQTGVKSFGCENSTPQESPSHSWKRILPSVVSASKSGAVSPIASAMQILRLCVKILPAQTTGLLAEYRRCREPCKEANFSKVLFRRERLCCPHGTDWQEVCACARVG